MTKNKKKLRRVEKRYSVTKSAQTLVLAGILLAGGVTGAGAAEQLTWGADSTTDKAVVIESTDVADAASRFAQSLTITGGSLTSTDNGVTVGTGNTTMSGGTLTLTNGGRLNTAVGTFEAGTISLTGTSSTYGRSGIYNSDTSKPTKGIYSFGIAGAADDLLTVTLAGGAGIEAKNVTINSGTFTISGEGTFTPTITPAWYGGSAINAGDDLLIKGGDITVGESGMLIAGSSDNGLQIQGGLVTLAGTTGKTALLSSSDAAGADRKGQVVIGGAADTATVQVTTAKYGTILSPTVNIENKGALNVEAGAFLLLNYAAYSTISGAMSQASTAGLTVDSTHLTVKNGGEVKIADAGLVTGAGGKLTVEEGGSVLFYDVANTPATVNTGLTVQDKVLTINGGGVVDVTGNMRIESSDKNHLGVVTVGNTGNLKVAGDLNFTTGRLNMDGGTARVSGVVTDTTVKAFTTTGNTGKLFMGKFVGADTGGSLNITTSLEVGFYGTGDGKQSIYNGDSITLNGTNARLTLGGGDVSTGDFATKGGTYAGKVDVTQGVITVNQGDWDLTNKSVSGGATGGVTLAGQNGIIMRGGTLTVAELNLKDVAESVVVGDTATKAAKLIINDTLSNVGTNNVGEIKVRNLGVVETTLDTVATDTSGSWTVDNTLKNSIDLETGSTLSIDMSKMAVNGKIDLSKVNDIKSDLLKSGSTGLIQVNGASITTTDGKVSASDSKGLVVNASLSDTSSALSGTLSTGVNNIVVSDKTSGTQALAASDLRLMGTTGGGQLVSGKDGAALTTTITVNDKGSLILGDSTGKSGETQGTLTGNVVLTATNSGTVSAVNGNFAITGDITTAAGKGTLIATNANLTVGNVGASTAVLDTLNVNTNGSLVTNDAFVKTVNVESATYATREGKGLTLSGSATVNGGGAMLINGLLDASTAANGITVGDKDGAGILIAKEIKLGGKMLFADPAWVTNGVNDGKYGSRVAVSFGKVSGIESIDGLVVAGQASQISLGTTNVDWLSEHLNQMKTWGVGVTAALGIYTSQTLTAASGAILVNGALDTKPGVGPAVNTATFADKSLLVVNADAATGGNVALKGDGSASTVTVADTAKLRIANAQSGQVLTVLKDFDITMVADKGWSEKAGNLTTDSHMLYGTLTLGGTGNAENATVTVGNYKAHDVFPMLSSSMAGLVDTFYTNRQYDIDSSNTGIKFLSRATNSDMMPSAERAATTIEGAAQLAVVGAAPAMTLAAVQAGTSAVTTRTSFASPLMDSTKAVALHKGTDGTVSVDSGLNAGNGMKNGFGLWIMPLYQSNTAWGMKGENFKGGYSSDLGGVALGADYTVNDMFRFGLAFNIGGGYAQSSGDFNKTDNSFSFWGINAYGGWTMNNFGITADVGYTGNYNKLEQELPGSMGMGDIKSDVTSSAWTAGLRGEYKFETEAMDIIPHVGVRYTGLTTDEYKAKSGGGTVFKVDQDFQSIWTFPVGVTFAKEIENSSGWIFRPQLDLGITPAAGDVKAKSKARIPGVDGSAEMKMQVVDYMSYDGGVGLEMKKDNISFGINYNIQASEHRTGHGVFGTFRYEF